jgi:hypothetical protein
MDFGERKTLGTVTLARRNTGPSMKFDSETNDLPFRMALGPRLRRRADRELGWTHHFTLSARW